MNKIINSLILAFSIIIAGYFISNTIYNSKVGVNTAEAKGLAEKNVIADVATLDFEIYAQSTSKSDLIKLFNKVEGDSNKVNKILKQQGLKDGEISNLVLKDYNNNFRDKNNKLIETNYSVYGAITITTKNIHLVEKIRSILSKLITKNIGITVKNPKYYFTKLNKIKPMMLKEATKNARIAADEFVKNVGATISGIKSARQGGFTILDEGSEYGDTAKINKIVRVVTTVSFYLENK